MPPESNPTIAHADDDDFVNQLDDLVDQIWRDLDGTVARVRIRQVAAEVAADFQNATVTTFVPIFVYRQTVGRLTAVTNAKR